MGRFCISFIAYENIGPIFPVSILFLGKICWTNDFIVIVINSSIKISFANHNSFSKFRRENILMMRADALNVC